MYKRCYMKSHSLIEFIGNLEFHNVINIISVIVNIDLKNWQSSFEFNTERGFY